MFKFTQRTLFKITRRALEDTARNESAFIDFKKPQNLSVCPWEAREARHQETSTFAKDTPLYCPVFHAATSQVGLVQLQQSRDGNGF